MYVYTCVCVCACVRACECIYIYIYIYIYVCVCARARVRREMLTYTNPPHGVGVHLKKRKENAFMKDIVTQTDVGWSDSKKTTMIMETMVLILLVTILTVLHLIIHTLLIHLCSLSGLQELIRPPPSLSLSLLG